MADWRIRLTTAAGTSWVAAGAGERLAAILRSEVEQGLPGERRCAMRLVI